MRTIIAGSRTVFDQSKVLEAILSCGWKVDSVISGGADGADALGEWYASAMGLPLEVHKAQWHKHGKRAGHLRNQVLANAGQALIAIWDGKSPGTRDMIRLAKGVGLPTFVLRV